MSNLQLAISPYRDYRCQFHDWTHTKESRTSLLAWKLHVPWMQNEMLFAHCFEEPLMNLSHTIRFLPCATHSATVPCEYWLASHSIHRWLPTGNSYLPLAAPALQVQFIFPFNMKKKTWKFFQKHRRPWIINLRPFSQCVSQLHWPSL